MSFKDNLIKISPYTPGEQPNKTDFIKLNSNENPYPPSPKVIDTIQSFDGNTFNKYPNANANSLCEAIAKRIGVERKNVFAGNGSDEVLALSFRAFFNSDKPIIYPDITYSFYPVWCEMLSVPYETIPVDDSFNINASDYKRENGGVIICNPNAPTSICRSLDFIREILDANQDSVVIVDEAYVDFGGISAIPLLKEYENLVVIQTFSKSRSLAGMRVGFAVAQETLINALYSAKDSFNSYPLDSFAIAIASASISDEEYFTSTVNKIITERDRLTAALSEMGFDVAKSSTNFLFATHPKYKAADISSYLKTKDIYVRHFNKARIDNHLRITIGKPDEITALINALKEYIK